VQIIPVQTLAKCLRRRLAQLHGISVLDVKKLEAYGPQVLFEGACANFLDF
jgi:hypothetical protein